MSYELEFDERAFKEWKSLNDTVKQQFKKKLEKVLINPHVAANKLSGTDFKDCYKIKLRSLGYRLIYQVQENIVVVFVVAIGKKDKTKKDVYTSATSRL